MKAGFEHDFINGTVKIWIGTTGKKVCAGACSFGTWKRMGTLYKGIVGR